MSKKSSLKDAFVRNAGAAAAVPAPGGVQHSSDTAIQLDISTTSPSLSLAGYTTATQPSSAAAYPEPAIQHAVSPYPQPRAVASSASGSAPPLKKKATFNLDAALHQRLKIAAAVHGREMVDIVEDALQTYLPRLDETAR